MTPGVRPMTDSLTCAACGDRVQLDDAHTVVDVTHRRPRDRDDTEQYTLHPRCARDVLNGWNAPA